MAQVLKAIKTTVCHNYSLYVILPMNMVVVFSPLSSSNSVSSVSSSLASTVTTAINSLVGNTPPVESSKRCKYLIIKDGGTLYITW